MDVEHLTVGGYRFSPLQATIQMDPEGISTDVTAANVCGINGTGHIKLSQGTMWMRLKPYAKASALEYTSECLQDVDVTERLEGVIDLQGDITAEGANGPEIIQNLNGHLDLRVTDGRI